MERRSSANYDNGYGEENREFSISANPRNYKFKNIKVVEPAWVGDTVTGHRTYRVISETANDFLKVIRRYSQFEALRNILVTQFPEGIVPVLPPKTYTEKITSDESDPVNKRMRGLKRFLETILNHSELCRGEEFIKFLRDSDFPVEFISKDSNTLDEDTSTLSKYMYSIYKVVRSTVSGSNEGTSFKSKTQNDFDLDKDYQRLISLKEFTEKLLENGEKLKQLFSDETDNLRNFRSFVPKLDLNISSIGTDLSSSLDEEVKPYYYNEEEKNLSSSDSKSRETEDSVAMTNSESSISNDAYNIIILIEDGIDLIFSAIDAIERRRKYKYLLEETMKEYNDLSNSSNDPGRQKEIIHDKMTTLAEKVQNIDDNLKSEIEVGLKAIEKNTIKYSDEFIKVRKTHLNNQKENWKKISLIVSENND